GAIAATRDAGLLGDLDIELRRGAGAYICGEETALFESIEGKRGEPRSKPPFPVEVGLFGKPTLVNNVETLANVPWILMEGADTYRASGTVDSAGTKLFCVSGEVNRPGLYETPFGCTLAQLLELAGGVSGGRPLLAVLLGGAAGSFVGPDRLDLPLTFEGTRAAGTTLGSGVVLVYSAAADLGDALVRIAEFFRHESCGQCVPCRVGTVRQLELLQRLKRTAPNGDREQEMALFAELAQAMRDASICGLGQTASAAIASALALFDPFPGVLSASEPS
ncbi:MAG: NADH-ubiquinone oxidoreductase-F iron-sulfur binding region domain-containing protein, partial [Thermoanaerobaculia bacterium]